MDAQTWGIIEGPCEGILVTAYGCAYVPMVTCMHLHQSYIIELALCSWGLLKVAVAVVTEYFLKIT